MTSPESGPVRERIEALDVLRGVAVAGILLANVLVFFGQIAIPPERAAALPYPAADKVAVFLEHFLVDAKFYSIFSLLFGIGFGLWLVRGGEASLPRFKRRLNILLAIGAVHAVFIWAGDILMLYALLGMTLPWFARKSDRELLKWVMILLAIPTLLYIVALVPWMAFGPKDASLTPSSVPPGIQAIIERMGTGNVWDAFKGNMLFLAGRWVDLFTSVRFPKVLGMFVLGLWTVRKGIALDPAAHRPLLVKWSRLGLLIGLPMNLLAAWAMANWAYLPPSPGGLIEVVGQAIGVPMLAIGYAATVGLLVVDGWKFVTVMAPVGRMALTNYLMHSIVCIVLSRGFGFGLWWNIGAAQAELVALIIIVVQIPLSAWWLKGHRFGPTEWVWRRLTYGRPI